MKKKLLCIIMTFLISDNYPYVKSHIATLQKKSANRESVNASGVDCRGADMPDIYLANSQLSGANFGIAKKISKTAGVISIPNQRTNLNNANFSGSALVSTNFEKASLQKVNFSGANILNANFSGADLTGAIFDNIAHNEYAVFCGATMPDGQKMSGKTWKSKSGQLFYAHCPKKSS